MRSLFLRRGQNLVDLALVIGVIGMVVVAMEFYIKRSVQGKVKDLANYIISDQQSESEDEVARSSRLTSDSVMTAEEFTGGGRRFTGTEDSTSTYSQ